MSRRTDPLSTIIGLVLAAGMVILLVSYKNDLESERDARTREVSALATQVETLGGTPVVEPGPRGEPGPAPTDEQVRAAVVAYLLANPPPSGRPPTDAEVDRAVALYCAVNNCRGPQGETGPAGANGADGQDGANGTNGADGQDGVDGLDGAPGPGPTDQQIADAVAAFCAANNGCRPASLRFTFLGIQYVCTDPDANSDYECVPT